MVRRSLLFALLCASLLSAGCFLIVKRDDGVAEFDVPDRPFCKRTVNIKKRIGPFSEAVVAGNTLYASGQIALGPDGEPLGSIEEETTAVMENLGKVLARTGFSFSHVVKVFVFLKDMNDYEAMNQIYATYFPDDPPARTTVEVSRLARGARVEISLIAVRR